VPRGKNPNSLKNLKPTKPGQVLNPQGINRKRPITDCYYQRSEEPLPENLRIRINASIGEEILKPGTTWAEASALRRFLDALMEGGTAAAKEIREAIEGKAPQRLEITGPEKKVVTIRVVYNKKPQRSFIS
jgi:hypothetical protein